MVVLKRKNQALNVSPLNEKIVVSEQDGEGVLSTVATLAIKAIGHLLPGLLAKGGEKIGDEIGNIVSKRINKLAKDKGIIETKQEGGAIMIEDVPQSKSVKGHFTNFQTSDNIGIFPTPLAGTKSKSEKHDIIVMNGKGIKTAGKQKGKGVKVSGKQGGKGVKTAGKSQTGGRYKGSGIKVAGDRTVNKMVRKIKKEPKTKKNISEISQEIFEQNEQLGSGGKCCAQIGSGVTAEKKAKILESHNQVLKSMIDKLGNEATTTTQLDEMGKKVFKKSEWGGVYPSDKLPRLGKNKYYIMNTDSSSQNGTHWIAIFGGKYFYDSFGRSAKDLSKVLVKKKLIPTNKNVEQSMRSENCGARAIAYLILYKIYGEDVTEVL